jgi:Flp pilus assembly pilin Flp
VRKLKSLLTNEDGQDLLEYALIIGMLALAGIISLHALSNSAFLGLNGIGNAITSSV